MAGIQHGGFKNSIATLFDGAVFALVPPENVSLELLERIKWLLLPVGFSKLVYTDAAEHDRMIAFTSQVAHVISNAFIKSPTAQSHQGFSAGSYKDLTRVAWLNPQMWSELFLSNRENLLNELNIFIDNLQQYKDAITNNDSETLIRLLEEGRKRKEEVDG